MDLARNKHLEVGLFFFYVKWGVKRIVVQVRKTAGMRKIKRKVAK